MRRLLITGASGFLGYNLCCEARGSWQVYGISNTHEVAIDNVQMVHCNITDPDALQTTIKNISPDAVVHAAALSDPNLCQQNEALSHAVTVKASQTLAAICAARVIPLVFISTDLVFDGNNAPYSENDPVSPISIYGTHKAEAEIAVRRECRHACICRLPLMFGNGGPVSKSFIQPMLTALRNKTPLRLFIDEFRTPLSAEYAAQGILLALSQATGIVHLGGNQRISRYQFGLLLAEILNISDPSITPCLRADVPMAAPRPADVSLKSERANAYGFNPPPLREQIKHCFNHDTSEK